MKKLSLFCAVGAVLLSGQAHADPKISGTIKATILDERLHSVERNETTNTLRSDTKTGRPILNGKSRFKYSGSNKINDVLTASYSFEYTINIDSEEDNFDSRSTYVSLDHKKYGRIRAGRMTSPENDFDIGVTNGDSLGTALPFSGFGPRYNNAFQYYSPYFGKEKATRIKLHYGMDENNDEVDREFRTFVDGKRTSKKRDGAVAQIMHNGKKYGWGLVYTQAGDDFKSFAGMARYQFTPKFSFSVLARQADFNSGSKETGAFVSANYDLQKDWRVYGQTGYTENFGGAKDATLNNLAIGVAKQIKTSSGRAVIFGELTGDWYETVRTSSSGHIINRQDDTIAAEMGLVYRF